jgi:transcriptional regulator with XRE-family HTH domain
VVALPTTRSPTLRRRQLGSELRRLRESVNLTLDQVAASLYCSTSKISRIETARVSATLRDVRDMLELYGIDDDHRMALMQLAREARQREPWWRAYSGAPTTRTLVSLEEAATSIQASEALLIPGLLQTEDYARSVFQSITVELDPQEVDRRVAIRMARQALLTRDVPPEVHIVIDEAVLRRLIGGREVMRSQLSRLLESYELPSLTLQVLTFYAVKYISMTGAFMILTFPDPTDRALVYIEHTAGDLYLEDEDQIHRHQQLFARLVSAALQPEDSLAFLVKLAKGL